MLTTFSLDNPATWTGFLLPILAAILALVIGWFASGVAQTAVRRWLPRAGGNSVTLAPLAGQAVRYSIMIFALITALGFVGFPSASILAVVGTASLALALALQSTLSNVAAGIMLAWIRPISVGDYITGDGVEGVVVEIGLFGTRLRSTSGLFVFTNNNRLWNGAITNHSREPRRRIDVNITIPDSANIAKARGALLAIAGRDKRVLGEPAPTVFVDSFGTATVTLKMRVWVPTAEYRSALRSLTEETKLGINKMLAAGDGGVAEVAEEEDPHVAHSGARTPDLGNGA
ncbi:MAG: mechanosensitive ion channel family protein [Devosia sp.]